MRGCVRAHAFRRVLPYMLARKEIEVVLHLAGKDLAKLASAHLDIAPVGNTQNRCLHRNTAHTVGLLRG